MVVYVRTSLPPDQFFAVVRSKVRELDANLPLYAMRSMDDQISNSLLTERLIASLSAVFGFLATLLAVIGLYGVMAYTVARRTREIGIRMALGAFQGDVIWMVMREVLVLVAVGLAAGLAGAFVLAKLVAEPTLRCHRARSGYGGFGRASDWRPWPAPPATSQRVRASRIDAMRALQRTNSVDKRIRECRVGLALASATNMGDPIAPGSRCYFRR